MTNETFTSVLIFDVDEQGFERLSGEVMKLLERKGSSIPGLVESAVLGNEARTQLWILSGWESQHAWAASQWDQEIGQTITDLIESAVRYRIEGLVPIAIVRRPEP